MKLHLGCGNKKWRDYVNVDLIGADVNCDLRKLPFMDGEVEEIQAIHVCEHFYLHEIVSVLQEWRRVLQKGGVLIVELPCWDKVKRHIAKEAPENMTRWALYGNPKTHERVADLHKWCYSEREFAKVLRNAGFCSVETEEPQFHIQARDMRLVAKK